MRFHPKLIISVAISFLASLGFFYFTMLPATHNDKGIVYAIGWIFWLGIYSFLMPLFTKRETAIEWVQTKYFAGTLLLCIIHIVLILYADYISFRFFFKEI